MHNYYNQFFAASQTSTAGSTAFAAVLPSNNISMPRTNKPAPTSLHPPTTAKNIQCSTTTSTLNTEAGAQDTMPLSLVCTTQQTSPRSCPGKLQRVRRCRKTSAYTPGRTDKRGNTSFLHSSCHSAVLIQASSYAHDGRVRTYQGGVVLCRIRAK